MLIKIKCKKTNDVLFSLTTQNNTIKKTIEKAITSGADLRSAYLRGADLSGVYLRGADLSGADLSGADLSGAGLSGADLSGADLRSADLSGADLSGVYLSGAYLRGADLNGAYLRGAYLSGVYLRGLKTISISDHYLLSQILLNSATTTKQREYAGLVRISTDWCYTDFIEKISGPCIKWCVSVLSKYPEFKEKFEYESKKRKG